MRLNNPAASPTKLWHDADLGVDLLRTERQTHSFSTHAHPELLLAFFNGGREVFRAAGQTWTARRGDLLVIPPGLAHDGAAADNDGYTYKAFYVHPKVLARTATEDSGIRVPTRPVLVAAPRIVASALAVHQTLEEREGSKLERQERLNGVIVNALVTAELVEDAGSDSQPLAAVRVRDYLDAHFHADVRTSDLARIAGVSESRLTHVFSAAFRCSPAVYQTSLRLSAARFLIREGHSIAEVATTVGFADQSHLSRRFKAAFGITPGRIEVISQDR